MMRNCAQRVQIESLGPFNRLGKATIDALAEAAVLYSLAPQEILYHQGELAQTFYVVVSGGVRLIEHTPQGKVVNHKVYGPDDVFGMLAISGAYPHPSAVCALDESVILGIEGRTMRELMGRFPELDVRMFDLMVEHIHHAHERLRQLSAEHVEQRLARALQHYMEKFGVKQDGRMVIDIPLSQQDVAEFIGTTQETINRTLKCWEADGIVARARRRIDVLDSAALAEIASREIPLP